MRTKSRTILLQAKVFGILVRLDLVFPRPILVEKALRVPVSSVLLLFHSRSTLETVLQERPSRLTVVFERL